MARSARLVGLAPAPPGQIADFVNPVTQTGSNIALHTVMLFFVTLCVAIRLYTRHFITRQLGLDDYLCMLAYCLCVTYAGLLLACGEYLLGHHLWDITLPNYIRGKKLETYAEWVYLALSAAIKLSCLLFYRRLFGPSLLMRRLIYAGIVFILATYIGLLITSILDCLPVVKHWNPTVPGHCLPGGSLAYGSGALNVVSDIFVVFMPLPALWRLNMKLSRRLKVMAVFGLGLIVVAMSITRIAETPLIFKEKDPTWELSNFAIYAILEMDIGLICACLLAFPAFIDRYGPALMTRLRSYTNFGRSASRGISAPSKEGTPNGNGKVIKYGSNEYAKLAGETSAMMMHDITPESLEPSYHSSQGAKVEHAESFHSLQSPHAMASAHIV